MSALVEHPVQGPQAPKANGNQPREGNSLMRITAGPAALAALMIYEIMRLYGEIIQMNQEQNQEMVKAQRDEAVGQAKATEEGGKALLRTAIAAGVLTIGGAIAGAALMFKLNNSGKAKEAENESNAVGKELKSMKSVDKMLKEPAAQLEGGTEESTRTAVNGRIEEFREGNFENASENENITKQAIQQMKAEDALRNAPGNEDNDSKVLSMDEFRRQFNDKYTRKTGEFSGWTNMRNTEMTSASSYNSILTNVGSQGGTVAQSFGQSEKAEQDARATLYGNSAQMSSTMSGESGRDASKAFDAQNAEMQTYKEMVNSGSANR